MQKTFAYWKEKYSGIFAGIAFSAFIYWINPELSKWKGFIQEIPNIGMCIFGFLLTFLGIILQGESKTIEWMKSREILFQRFIAFNKRVVILSIVLSVYAYFLGYFNFEWLAGMGILQKYPCILSIFIRFLISAFFLLFVWLLIDILIFTKIFYLLIKKI
ncbi:MAG: hypothetical protein LBT50_03885 [Prevotellaceae bacterium]|jgi:hypothetical protein|nr:hypothetical protein [Prevotellaceae bacterium]